MQFERVPLNFIRGTNPEEITQLFAKRGELRLQYDELRKNMENDLVKRIEEIQKFLNENAPVKKFDMSDIKNAFEISLKMALVKMAIERLLIDGKSDLNGIIRTDASVFKEGLTKYAAIEAFILLLKEEVYEEFTSFYDKVFKSANL